MRWRSQRYVPADVKVVIWTFVQEWDIHGTAVMPAEAMDEKMRLTMLI